ncbi:hypothetical protein ACHAWF_007208 [Thalassiosira exigua]
MRAAFAAPSLLLARRGGFVPRPSPPPSTSTSTVSSAASSSSLRRASPPRTNRAAARPLALSMTSSSSAAPPPSTSAVSSALLGGDHAGLSATFSSSTGELIPVPDHLVPESMLEWGAVPSSLEVLVSEDLASAGEKEGGGGGGGAEGTDEPLLERTTVTALPEVGCGIDNLEVATKVDRYDASSCRLERRGSESGEEVAAIRRRTDKGVEFEVVFRADGEEADDEGATRDRRVRVSLSLDLPSDGRSGGGEPAVSKLITMQVARRASEESTRGTAWTGPKFNSGGLDAGTVVKMIGKHIVYGDVFAVKKVKGGGDPWDLSPDDLEGTWTKKWSPPRNEGIVEKVLEGRTRAEGGKTWSAARLPQNVLVRHGPAMPGSSSCADFAVEVSRTDVAGPATDGDATRRLRRRGVVWSLGGSSEEGGGEGGLGRLEYFAEDKEA